MEELQRHTRQTCVNTAETAGVQKERIKPTWRGFVIYNLWPKGNCGVFAPQKLKYVVCALLGAGHVGVAWKPPKATQFWESGFKFAFGRNKKGKVFGILSQLKKTGKSNDVHAQNKTFLSSP